MSRDVCRLDCSSRRGGVSVLRFAEIRSRIPRFVDANRHVDLIAEPRKGLVYGAIDDFLDVEQTKATAIARAGSCGPRRSATKYLRATTIRSATAAIADGAIPLAGGTVLVPGFAVNGARGRTIVDIGRIAGLSDISLHDDHLQIGALVTLARIATDPLVATRCTALAEAAASVGNPQVRRAATIGGNVAVGVRTADTMPALLALDAQVMCHTPAGLEICSVMDFQSDGRMITGVRIPLKDLRSSFRKCATRHASGITIVSAAVAVAVRDGRILSSRVVAGGLAWRPARQPNAEALLTGHRFETGMAELVGATAAEEALCDVDGPPSERFRRRLLASAIRDTLTEIMRT